ncbi:MAG: site-specific integrase [Hyphomonadaceae bacterium]
MASIDKRRGKWRAQVRRDGHSICKTFLRKSDAEEWARDLERAIDKQIDPTTRQVSRKDSFASLIDLHINDLHEVGKPLRRSKRSVLNRLRVELGATPLSGLTRDRLIQYGRQRAKDGAGPATLAVDISFIGTILTDAAAVHGVAVDAEAVRLARVALRRLGLVGAADERERRPTEKELEKLFAHFDANPRYTIPMTRVLKFAIATAMRIDEIFRIEWHTLDERTRTILVPDRKDPRKKDGNDQRVPLLSATGYDAWELLQEQRDLRLNGPRCFPHNAKSAGTAFQRAVKDLGIIDLHFHDMRHEATSRLFEAGLTIEQVPLVTGHKDWKQLKRYTQLKPEGLYAKLAKGSVQS